MDFFLSITSVSSANTPTVWEGLVIFLRTEIRSNIFRHLDLKLHSYVLLLRKSLSVLQWNKGVNINCLFSSNVFFRVRLILECSITAQLDGFSQIRFDCLPPKQHHGMWGYKTSWKDWPADLKTYYLPWGNWLSVFLPVCCSKKK